MSVCPECGCAKRPGGMRWDDRVLAGCGNAWHDRMPFTADTITPTTCEDRDYACCEAFPPPSTPTADEYAAWYDAHLAAYVPTMSAEDWQGSRHGSESAE